MFSKDQIQKIKDEINFHSVIESIVALKRSGASFKGDCPYCNAKGKFEFNPNKYGKGVYKCFSCDEGGTDPIKFYQTAKKISFGEALNDLSKNFNVLILDEIAPTKRIGKKNADSSFRDISMKESGIPLTAIKVSAKTRDHKGNAYDLEIDEFESGGLDRKLNYTTDDDMIINYLDLEGRPIMFSDKNSSNQVPFKRLRYKHPNLHRDANGKEMKYWQPYGSGTQIFIPNEVRKLYQNGTKTEVLHFEEGEKKAKKKSIHGMPAMAFMGINSIARKIENGLSLPEDVVRFIEKNNVQKVVFNLDSDWKDLKITNNSSIDSRPKQFYAAIISFRNFFRELKLILGYELKIYVSSILPEHNQKGSDDLLTNVLKAKESDLKEDYNIAFVKAEGKAKYIHCIEITEISDYKIKEMLNIQNSQAFAISHKEVLKNYSSFKIGNIEWRFNSDGVLELAQPLHPSEEFWTKHSKTFANGDTKVNYEFCYTGLKTFLQNRGFSRYYMSEDIFYFVRREGNIVKEWKPEKIRSFVVEFAEEINVNKEVLELLYRGGDQYLSSNKLFNIASKALPLYKPVDENQFLYFRTLPNDKGSIKCWKISNSTIQEDNFSNLDHCNWNDKIIDFPISYSGKPLLDVNYVNGKWEILYSEEAKKCDFLKFLSNTSNFAFEDIKNVKELSWEDRIKALPTDKLYDHNHHLISKLTGIGYMLHDYRDGSVLKALVAMDGKQSEVGQSNGRTGKSLLGVAFEKMVPLAYISGKSPKLFDDQFVFQNVDERKRIVFIDDVLTNFNFEYLFPYITGKFTVNQKGTPSFTIPEDKTPKIYITTNHALNGDGDSFLDRQHVIVFSDFYSADFKPLDDFNQRFFDDWDTNQWNLFYNLQATCLHIYFKFKKQFSGPIKAPMGEIDLRRLRQQMGETFLQWAEGFFNFIDKSVIDTLKNSNAFEDRNYGFLNFDIERHKCEEIFIKANPSQKFLTTANFKKKVKVYCKYKGLQFNPGKIDKYGNPGADDKRNGKEYFLVADTNFTQNIISDQPF